MSEILEVFGFKGFLLLSLKGSCGPGRWATYLYSLLPRLLILMLPGLVTSMLSCLMASLEVLLMMLEVIVDVFVCSENG